MTEPEQYSARVPVIHSSAHATVGVTRLRQYVKLTQFTFILIHSAEYSTVASEPFFFIHSQDYIRDRHLPHHRHFHIIFQ